MSTVSGLMPHRLWISRRASVTSDRASNAQGKTVVAYIPPSTQLAGFGNPMLDKAAGMLDEKLAAMVGIGYGMAGDIIPHGVRRALHAILDDPQYAPEDEKASARLGKWAKAQLFRGLSLVQRLKK